jgi:hypothetical protein
MFSHHRVTESTEENDYFDLPGDAGKSKAYSPFGVENSN